MMKRAVLIFAKNLIYGEVKTRLAATAGNDRAFAVYRELLKHTQTITKDIIADKIVFYSGNIEMDDIWLKEFYQKEIQQGNELGNRMENAFAHAFEKGYDEAIIVGTDCLELTSSILTEAFTNLKDNDIVLGPAKDGGYYLLGMNKLNSELFQNISWSTGHVLQQTKSICINKNLTYYLLQELSDIDVEKDIPENWNKENSDITQPGSNL